MASVGAPGPATMAGVRALNLLHNLITAPGNGPLSTPESAALVYRLTMQHLQVAAENPEQVSTDQYQMLRNLLQAVSARQFKQWAEDPSSNAGWMGQSLAESFRTNVYTPPAGTVYTLEQGQVAAQLAATLLDVPLGGLNLAAEWITAMAAAKKRGII